MPNSNSALRRIEAGAIITVSDGSTTLTVVQIRPGTLRWKSGWYNPLKFTDRGVNQIPYEGDERPGSFQVDALYTGAHDSADLKKFFSQRDTTTGKMKMYTWVIKNPTVKGGATGEQITIANSYFHDGLPEIEAGVEFDLTKISMEYVGPDVATTTY